MSGSTLSRASRGQKRNAETTELAVASALPASYELARAALEKCERVDECKTWKDKAAALASYAQQAGDVSLFKSAMRIKGRAVRRMGELLREIEPKRGGDRGNAATGGRVPIGETRASVAEAAGLSRDQAKQALRVAALPKRDFEKAIDATEPPTITALARQGTKPSTAHLKGREPGEFQVVSRVQGALRSFVAVTEAIPTNVVARAALEHERAEMAKRVRAVSAWLAQLGDELDASDARVDRPATHDARKPSRAEAS